MSLTPHNYDILIGHLIGHFKYRIHYHKGYFNFSDSPTMNEVYTLENNHYESGNKYKMYDFPDKRIMIWTDFQRINTTHFKARFEINFNR